MTKRKRKILMVREKLIFSKNLVDLWNKLTEKNETGE